MNLGRGPSSEETRSGETARQRELGKSRKSLFARDPELVVVGPGLMVVLSPPSKWRMDQNRGLTTFVDLDSAAVRGN
jgi:hypothetical protein